jgi:hypothetical protein
MAVLGVGVTLLLLLELEMLLERAFGRRRIRRA